MASKRAMDRVVYKETSYHQKHDDPIVEDQIATENGIKNFFNMIFLSFLFGSGFYLLKKAQNSSDANSRELNTELMVIHNK